MLEDRSKFRASERKRQAGPTTDQECLVEVQASGSVSVQSSYGLLLQCARRRKQRLAVKIIRK